MLFEKMSWLSSILKTTSYFSYNTPVLSELKKCQLRGPVRRNHALNCAILLQFATRRRLIVTTGSYPDLSWSVCSHHQTPSASRRFSQDNYLFCIQPALLGSRQERAMWRENDYEVPEFRLAARTKVKKRCFVASRK